MELKKQGNSTEEQHQGITHPKITYLNIPIIYATVKDMEKYMNNANNHIYYMFHKPAGCITARTDACHKTVLDYFPKEKQEILHPIGRLDIDTEGLLLLTDDGNFTNQLMSPENHVEKTYEFIALGDLREDAVTELQKGIYFTGDDKITKPCKITVTARSTLQEALPLLPVTPTEKTRKNRPEHPVTYGTMTITEGRKHHVKRLLKHAHCHVIYLKRVSIGGLVLDETLKPGEYRELTKQEVDAFF